VTIPLPGDNIKFEEIKNAVKGVKFVTLRSDSDELFEAVLVKSDLGQLTGCLVKIFGEPVFPEGKKYPFDPQKLVEDYGGIMPGQTLYYLEQDLIFAMLWPWQDGVNITFKLIKKPQ
jgi:hypothetical protein